MDQDERSDRYKVAFNIQRTIMMFGLCAKANRVPFWLAQIAHACFVVLLVTQTIALVMVVGDMEKLFECFSVLSFCCMGALKVKSIRSNYNEWSLILKQLDALEIQELDEESSHPDYESDDEDIKECCNTHIKKYTGTFQAVCAKMFRLYYFTCSIHALSPFIEYLYWSLNSEGSIKYPHILPGWSPLETFGFWGYLVTVAAELIASFYTVTVHLAFDLMVLGLMIFLSGQFLLLRDLTEGIAGKGQGYDLTPQRDARARCRIIRCHRTLLTLENSVIKLDKLVRTILGIYFLVAIFTLCSVAVRLSSEEMSVMKVASLLQYTGSCLIQLFLYCFYGDLVFQTSSVGMGEGVYACAWWRLSPRVRREALLLAAVQARVRRLRAGPFNSLALPSFIQIIRAAYSYYAVVRK